MEFRTTTDRPLEVRQCKMRVQRLNMDSTWLLTLGGTTLLVDPWLHGSEVDYAGWFNTQWHRTPPLPYRDIPTYDAVLITQKYPDHYHADTLAKLSPKVVFAPASLGKRLRTLLPDADLHLFEGSQSVVLFRELTLTHLPTRRRIDPIYDAFLVDDGKESVCIAPHGLAVDAAHQTVVDRASPCKLLISPFNRYSLPALLGGTVTPGLEGLEQLIDALAPEHVVQTHDELKEGKGLIPKIASITVFDPSHAPHLPWLADRFLNVPDYQAVEL